MLQEVSFEEFQKFAEKEPLYTFHQTKEWAELKEKNGWSHVFLLYTKGKKKAGALLLLKPLLLGKKMCYSPRGFLLDYEDRDLVKDFTDALKTYLKKKGAIFVKIDPPLLLNERDKEGALIENGIDHHDVVTDLKSLGYIHYGFQKDIEKELQPRWVFVLPLKDKSEEELYAHFDSRTKRSLKKCEKEGLVVEEMQEDEISLFKAIMEHTSSRRGFLDRPLSYYQNLKAILKEHCIVLLCYLDCKKARQSLKEQKEEQEKKREACDKQKESKKYEKTCQEIEERLSGITAKMEALSSLEKEKGSKILLGGSMFLQYGRETTYLFGGSFQEFMQYPSQYLIQWESIQRALKKGCTLYNFYGIDGNFDTKGKMHGIYEFKRGFDGEVREYIGEFDLPISKGFYRLYKIAFSCYKKIKNRGTKKKS